jgi:integrase
LADARAWRQETQVAVRRLTVRAPTKVTVQEAATAWLKLAEAGLVRAPAGTPYKPSSLRGYRIAIETKLLPELGHLRLSSVSRNCVQDLVDRLVGTGLAPSSVRNAVLPLRAIYRRALDRGEVALNPTLKLSLPALKPRRERVPRAREAVASGSQSYLRDGSSCMKRGLGQGSFTT